MAEKKTIDIKKYLFLIISGGGLCLVWAVNLIFFLDNPGFIGVALHPYLLLVVIVASIDGFPRAMVTAGLVSLSYGASIVFKLALNFEELSRIFQFSYFSPFISFLIIGTMVGIMTDRHKKKLLRMEGHVAETAREVNTLREHAKSLEGNNTVLKRKCVTERELITMLYNTAKKLTTLNLKDIQQAIIDVCQDFTEAPKAALFMKQGDKLILCASQGYASGEVPSPSQTILKMTIDEKRVLSIKEIAADGRKTANPVFLSAPLVIGEHGDVAGLIWLEELPFLRYTPMTTRLVTLLADWASLCLANIYAFEALKKKTEERNFKLHLNRIYDSLAQKYNGVFEYGVSRAEIEKELGQKLSLR